MPSLQELYERTSKYHRYNPALYDVLKALVEAVEPDETPTIEQYNDVRDATIRKLCSELAKAKAEITDLKARTHRIVQDLRIARDSLQRQYEAAEDRLASYNADAEIGRLVRGMPDGTALQRSGHQYYAMRCHPKVGWRTIAASDATRPAEALRAIQEVDDAGA